MLMAEKFMLKTIFAAWGMLRVTLATVGVVPVKRPEVSKLIVPVGVPTKAMPAGGVKPVGKATVYVHELEAATRVKVMRTSWAEPLES
ncbi:MAG: hypothetical protein DDT35_01123 [Firmicutes bacterium]|nr:hypothetical protein [Bacillota bacterium]